MSDLTASSPSPPAGTLAVNRELTFLWWGVALGGMFAAGAMRLIVGGTTWETVGAIGCIAIAACLLTLTVVGLRSRPAARGERE